MSTHTSSAGKRPHQQGARPLASGASAASNVVINGPDSDAVPMSNRPAVGDLGAAVRDPSRMGTSAGGEVQARVSQNVTF